MVASAPHIVGAFPPGAVRRQGLRRPGGDEPAGLHAGHPRRVPRARRLGRRRHARRRRAAIRGSPTARWPRPTRPAGRRVPGVTLPPAPMTTYRLDFGPDWTQGHRHQGTAGLGAPFVSRVPAVDEAGNDRGGIRLPRDRGAAGDPHRLELPAAGDRRAGSPGQRDRLVPAAAADQGRPRAHAATAGSRSKNATPAARTTWAASPSPR